MIQGKMAKKKSTKMVDTEDAVSRRFLGPKRRMHSYRRECTRSAVCQLGSTLRGCGGRRRMQRARRTTKSTRLELLRGHCQLKTFGSTRRSKRTDGGQCDTDHGCPDGNLVPAKVDEPQQESSQSCFGDGHPNDGKALADTFVQRRLDNILSIADLCDGLAEAIVAGDVGESSEDDEEYLF